MRRILVVDDEAGVRESLRILLRGEYDVIVTKSVDEALRAQQDAPPDLVLLDLVMPGRSGLEFLEANAQAVSPPPVVVISATRAVDTAVQAMKLGAADYVTKPFDADALRFRLRQLLKHRGLEEEVQRLRDEIADRSQLCGLIGASEAMRLVFRLIERAANSRSTALISGESGTGKELVASALHQLSPRQEGPFVVVNCAAIPDTLLESELFGHERGAFTDARERHIGRFEAASGGTLFLDEIGELALPLQAKLLRALQEQKIDRVGAKTPVAVDVRVVAATNRDLRKAVEERQFRSDLYYRIHVLPIQLPPLRARRGDVRLLAENFLSRAGQTARRSTLRLHPETLETLEQYDWPGNVRELENALERAVALGDGDEITPSDLPEEIRHASRVAALGSEVRRGQIDLESAVSRFESEMIRETLAKTRGNQTRAAEQLGITRRVLKLKMDRYGIGMFQSERFEFPSQHQPLHR